MGGKDMQFGIYSYLLVCRETKSEFLEFNFDKIQKTLRVRTPLLMAVVYEQNDRYEGFAGLVLENEALP